MSSAKESFFNEFAVVRPVVSLKKHSTAGVFLNFFGIDENSDSLERLVLN